MRNARRLLRALVLSALVASVIVPASNAAASPSPKSLQNQISAAQTKFDKLVDQYDGVDQDLKDNQTAELKQAKAIQPALLASQVAQSKVGQYAAQAYINGPVSTIAVLISASNTTDMLNSMGTADEMAIAQRQQISGYTKDINAYNVQKKKLDGLISTEKLQRKSLATQKATIKANLAKLYALRTAAGEKADKTGAGSGQSAPYSPGRGGKVVRFAYAQLGKRYVWGSAGPNTYDCSGLVLAAYHTVGVNLYHQTTHQWNETHHISRSQLRPGDIVFYEPSSIHHVAIYIGNGRIIHAPNPSEVVKISSMHIMPIRGYGRP